MIPPDSPAVPAPAGGGQGAGKRLSLRKIAFAFGLIAVIVFFLHVSVKVDTPDDDFLATVTTLARFTTHGDLYDNWHGCNYLVYWFRPLIIIPGALFTLWPSPYLPVVFDALLYGGATGCGVYLFGVLLGVGRRFIVLALLLLWLGWLMPAKTTLLMLPVLLALHGRHWRPLAAAVLLLLMDSPLAGFMVLLCGAAALLWRDRRRAGLILLLAGLAATMAVVYAHGILLPQPFLPHGEYRPPEAVLLADGLRATQTMVIMLLLVLAARAFADTWAATAGVAAAGLFFSMFMFGHGHSADRHEFPPLPDARALTVLRENVPDRDTATLAVPGAVIPRVLPAGMVNAVEGHDQPFTEDWVLLDTRLPVASGRYANDRRNLYRLVRQVERGHYGVVHCADGVILLKRGLLAQPPAELYAALDRMLTSLAGDTIGFAGGDAQSDTLFFTGRCSDAGGVMIPLPAGVLRLNSTDRITALGIANAALGRQVRLPWPVYCRFSEVLFIPLELLVEGDNELTLTLWSGATAGAVKTVVVNCDLIPPRLVRAGNDGWQALDNSGQLRLFLWQPARAPRLVCGNFKRLDTINAWRQREWPLMPVFRPETARAAVMPVDESLLRPDDMLLLEDGAGQSAVYARENGEWRLLGTKYAGYNPDTEGLPNAWEMAAPLMPR